MTPRRPTLLAAAALLFLPSADLAGQSAQEIMDDARAAYEARMADVQDYTVTQTVLGIESTLHFTRQEVDGHLMFVPDLSGMGASDPNQFDANYFMSEEFVERLSVDGTETVDGSETWVLSVQDFEGLDIPNPSGGASDFEPSMMRLYFDQDLYVPRRIDMAGALTMNDSTFDVSTTILMSEYQEVDDVLYPFRMEISNEGLGEAMGAQMSEEELAEMRAQLAAMEEQLAELPEAQRAMLEGMLSGRIEGMQQVLNQAMSNIVVETTGLVVNQGPPGGH